MSLNGASRMVQAENEFNKESQSSLNAKFKNENEVSKKKKFPLTRNNTSHNHSK